MNNPYEEDDSLPLGIITLSQNDEACLVITVTPWDNVEITSTTLPQEKAELICTMLIESTDYSEETNVNIEGGDFSIRFTQAGCDPVAPSEEKLAEISEVLAEAEKVYEKKRSEFFAQWEGKHEELFNQFFEDFPEDTKYVAEAGDPVYYQCTDCEESHWRKTSPAVNMNTKNGNRVVEFCTYDECDWETEGEYDNESIKESWGSDFLHDYWNYVTTDGYFLGLVRYHCFCAETGTDPIEEWLPFAKNKDDLKAAKDALKYLKM